MDRTWRRMGKIGLTACFVFLTLGVVEGRAAVKITSIDFKVDGDTSKIEIRSSAPIQYTKTENAGDKQLVLDFKDAELSKLASRKLDTSSFDSPVTMVSPYSVDGTAGAVRVVVQLRQMASSDISQDGNVIRVSLKRASSKAEADPSTDTPADKPTDQSDDQAANGATTPAKKSNLDQFMETEQTKHFVGKPITIQLRNADMGDAFRLIADASGFNIVIGEDVKGKITLSLVDVPWDQALDMILRTNRLGAERNNNVLRIATLESLTREKQMELAEKTAAQASEPRITRIFQISYANVTDLSKVVSKFLAKNTATPGQAPSATDSVQADTRTNSLIVQDTVENVDKVKKLIEILDAQTPQVLVEAKVLEATETFAKNLNGQVGAGGNTGFAAFNGANPLDPLVGTPGLYATGTSVQTAMTLPGASLFAFSPNVTLFNTPFRLNAILNWAESESLIKVVSSPKTVVLSKQTADVVQSTPVAVPQTTNSAGVITTTYNILQANIELKVTPTVTNEGSVLMDLSVSRDVPQSLANGATGAVANRNLKTQVLVDSGSTLVIGGIYTVKTEHDEGGFPILRKIPILGWLFGSNNDTTDRSELFFFVTPKVINSKESGLIPTGA